MNFNFPFDRYNNWIETNGVSFKRSLQNETAFDGIVKIYSLKTDSEKVNKLLKQKVFGEFHYIIDQGVFLRLFENKDSWPETRLIFLDLEKFLLIDIKKTDSSWNVWKGNKLEEGKYSIEISPEENIEFQIN